MDDKPDYPRFYHLDQRRISTLVTNEPSPYQTPIQEKLQYQPLEQSQIPRLSIAERFMTSTPGDTVTHNKKPFHTTNEMVQRQEQTIHHPSLPFTPSDNINRNKNASTLPHHNEDDRLSPTTLKQPISSKQHGSKRLSRRYDEESQGRLENDHPIKFTTTTTTTTTVLKTTGTETSFSGDSIQHEEKALATNWHSMTPQNNKESTPSQEGFWYCHRGCLLLCLFFFILVFGFLLFLVWPRVPLLRIEGASVVSPVEIVQTQQGWMENVMFTTSWLVNVTVDNRQNYIPTRLNKVQVIVKDAVTNALVGKGSHYDGGGDSMDLVLMDGISTVSLLVTVNYQARDMSDTTFLDLVHACHRNANDPPSSLPLHFWITLYMFGFDWLGFTPTIIATPASSGFFCPV